MAVNGPVRSISAEQQKRVEKVQSAYDALYKQNTPDRITVVVNAGFKQALTDYGKAIGLTDTSDVVRLALAAFIGWDARKELSRPDQRKRHDEAYKATRKAELAEADAILKRPSKATQEQLQKALAILKKYESDRRDK
jgi:hypothetical protein